MRFGDYGGMYRFIGGRFFYRQFYPKTRMSRLLFGADFGGPDVPPVTHTHHPNLITTNPVQAFSENDIFDEQPAQPIVTELGQDEEPIVMGIDEVDQTETDSPFGGDESIGDTGPDWERHRLRGMPWLKLRLGPPSKNGIDGSPGCHRQFKPG